MPVSLELVVVINVPLLSNVMLLLGSDVPERVGNPFVETVVGPVKTGAAGATVSTVVVTVALGSLTNPPG